MVYAGEQKECTDTSTNAAQYSVSITSVVK